MSALRNGIEQLVSVPIEPLEERRRRFVDGLRFRAVTASIFIFVFAFLDNLQLTSARALPGVLPLLVTLVLLNWGYWIAGKSRAFPLADFVGHWVLDEILISIILFRLGGLAVPYGFLAYVMIVVTSATFISKRASFVVATGAALASVSLTAIELGKFATPPVIWSLEAGVSTKFASVTFAIIFYFIFAYLAGTLAEQLRAANHALQDARNRIAEQNRELETKVEERTTQLERRNSEIEEFVHVVTHDLKNVSVGTTEVARLLVASESNALTPKGLRYAQHLIDDSRQMNQMLGSLLGIFRVDREKQLGAVVDVGAVVEVVMRSQTKRLESKGISVEIGEMPTIRVDEARLTHVLTNLVDNAIKYVGDKPEKTIKLSSVRMEGAWAIRVSDNGIGIPPDQADRIFQLYHRAPQQVVGGQVQLGEGVGLAMCRRIVERWGGRIWVESAVGRGSTFVFLVPDWSEASA